MIGMDAQTGRSISDLAHLRQSIQDILTTPLGSCVMNREYGSLLPELLDHPTHPANALRCMAASVMAISRWEPRVVINQVKFELGEVAGKAYIDLVGSRLEAAGKVSALNMNVPVVLR